MLIKTDEFGSQVLYGIYRDAHMEPTVDDDGDLLLRVDGLRICVTAMPDRPFLVLRAGFKLKPTAQREECLELANRLNDNMVLIRCCIPTPAATPVLFIDHFTMTVGGITGEEVVAVTRRFCRVIGDGLREYDTDHLVG